MRKYILLMAMVVISIPNVLFADLITLVSGKEIEAVIKEETEEEVIFLRDTGKATFPRAHIKSIIKYSDEENRKLKDKWKNGPAKSGSIVTCYDNLHRYIVYLPAGYNPESKWPVLFCFDPNGVGAEAASRFKEATGKYNWIVVGSLDAQNGPWGPIIKAQKAMMKDIARRYNVDEGRFYAAGFSGGARMAYTIAYNNPKKFRGIIACAAGFGLGRISKNIAVYHCIGKYDCTLKEVQDAHATLLSLGAASQINEFEGEHDWPPREVISSALDWIAAKNQGN